MNIITRYMTNNRYYRNPIFKPKGLMLHSTGTPCPIAQNYIDNYNKPTSTVGVHGFIESSGDVYRTLPDVIAGHCGGSANNLYLGFEMCEPATIEYTGGATFIDHSPQVTYLHVLKTYQTAVELFTSLCREHSIDPSKPNLIISHSEGHKLGIASNHADVEHLWGKFNLTMNEFRNDIIKALKQSASIHPTAPTFTPYMVKVLPPVLNIRTGAGIEYPTCGHITDQGVYTIVDQNKSWGKLKSGAGWISLDYCRRATS